MGLLSEVSGVLAAETARFRSGYDVKAFSQIPDIAEVAAPENIYATNLFVDSSNFAQGFSHFRYHIYSIVNHIAMRLAGQPINVGEIVEGDGQPSRTTRRRLKAYDVPIGIRATSRLSTTEDIQIVQEGPLVDALEHPNRIQSKNDFVYCLGVNLLIAGEAYVIGGMTKRDGRPELWAPPVRWIIPRHEGRLFSGYVLKTSSHHEGIALRPESVARIYLPDPTDPKAAISPVFAQLRSVHIDEHIQASQERAFENGIFPGIALHVGRIGGKEKAPRKLLQAHQRRQLISAVRKIYGGVARAGEPLILDALIEQVSQITKSPREMDWSTSSEIVRKRLYHAFGLNPINTGEISGVNKAQATVAENHQAVNVLNPLLEKLSAMLNEFVLPMFYEDAGTRSRTVAWFEPARAYDEELQAKEYEAGSRLGFIRANEFRRRVGLGPLSGDQSTAIANPNMVSALVNLIGAVGNKIITEKSAALMISKILLCDESEAMEFVRGAGAPPAPQVKPRLPAA